MKQDVLVVGNGGREHALVWKLSQSLRIGKLYIAPGNGGTRDLAKNIPIRPTNVVGLLRFAEENKIGLTVVGPDDPLALGIGDAFRARGLRIFGPTRAAAEIESSKAFAKELMREANIPTASFRVFDDYSKALAYVHEHGVPIVVKASGLALGKGVYVCKTQAEAESALREIMHDRVHKDAGNKVVIEEFLDGQEISIHAFCDGKTSILLPPAQDHKPIHDGDQGKNTGGMGTIAPVPWVTRQTLRLVDEQIVRPTLQALAKSSRPFTGLLYPGLKMTSSGPKVLEFNARFGDPETQSYMRLLKTDLLDILEGCVDGSLSELNIEWNSGFAVCVVIASGGYPDEYKKGIPVSGLAEAESIPGIVVFHAGTEFTDELRTSGGRVLGVSAIGSTLEEALSHAYRAVQMITFEGMQYRHDIGAKVRAVQISVPPMLRESRIPNPESRVTDIRAALRDAFARLEREHVPSAPLAAELLLMHVLGKDRTWLYAHPEYELSPEQRDRYFALIARRSTGVPTQHLTGHQEFWGLDFEVTPEVLIPRPETEHLIEVAMARLGVPPEVDSERRRSEFRIADIGTGSGCIAVALARVLPGARVIATDISAAALEVARRNAARHGVDARIEFMQCNLLDAVLDQSPATSRQSLLFDLIASNPPYVARREAETLPREVRENEPQAALFGGESGTEMYAPLIAQAAGLLKPGGILALELGYNSAKHVLSLLPAFDWTDVTVTNDLAGIPRVASARRPG
jgi:phosphoribosylamine---glycine ligase